MKNCLIIFALLIVAAKASAQFEVSRIIGKNSAAYKNGYGIFLKIGYPVTEQSEVNAELAMRFFFAKSGEGAGIGLFPVMAGYRYVFSETGSGIYIEPQLGYNFYEDVAENGDGPYKGLAYAIGTGYLSPSFGRVRINPGIKYETVRGAGGGLHYLVLRLAINVMIGNRD